MLTFIELEFTYTNNHSGSTLERRTPLVPGNCDLKNGMVFHQRDNNVELKNLLLYLKVVSNLRLLFIGTISV